MLLNNSPAKWMDVPLPLEAMLSLPGLALAYFDKIRHVVDIQLLGFFGIHHHDIGHTSDQGDGAKSLTGSNGILSYSATLMPCVPTVPMSRV